MNPATIVLTVLFYGIMGLYSLVSLLAIFIVIKYGRNSSITFLLSGIYAGFFFAGFFVGLAILNQ